MEIGLFAGALLHRHHYQPVGSPLDRHGALRASRKLWRTFNRGISTGDFPEALAALLGPSAEGLGATNICRLERLWEDEWEGWSRRDLWGKRYVQV